MTLGRSTGVNLGRPRWILRLLTIVAVLVSAWHFGGCKRSREGRVGEKQEDQSKQEQLQRARRKAVDSTKRDASGRYPVVY